jgi:recombinase-like zinc beta ribbon protein
LRRQGAKLHQAHTGALRCNPPTGYIDDPAGALVMGPAASVVAALHLRFAPLNTWGSADGVLRVCADHRRPRPRRLWAPGTNGRLHWGPLRRSRLLAILHHPTDTGAYVYGRRRTHPVVVAGQVVRTQTLQRPQAPWMVVIQDAHPADLRWEDAREHQRQLTRHRTDLARDGRQGVPRGGAALLPGLLRCGRCGRRMPVRDHGPTGQRAVYQCDRRRVHDGQGGRCWRVPARPIDAAVATPRLEALTPAHVDLAWAVLHQRAADARELDRHWQLQLERARDEGPRAERQCAAVDPENRWVARTLERRWHETRPPVEALERAAAEARRRQRRAVSQEERPQILRLAADLPAVWQAPITTQAERQELLSRLVQQIALTPVEGSPRQTQVQGRWHTEATTARGVPRPSQRARGETSAPSEVEASRARRDLLLIEPGEAVRPDLRCPELIGNPLVVVGQVVDGCQRARLRLGGQTPAWPVCAQTASERRHGHPPVRGEAHGSKSSTRISQREDRAA